YLHLLRHPGAMMRSFEEARLEQVFFRYRHAFAPRQLAELVWTVSHQNIREFLAEVDQQRQCVVVFEELVRQPEAVLRRVCQTLDLPYEPAMAEPYAEPQRRMTDGLHRESRMLGDVKFHSHQGIDARVAERWREGLAPWPLAPETWALAAQLGYDPASEAKARVAGSEVGRRMVAVARDEGPLLASSAQRRLWFLDQLEPDRGSYNMPAAVRLQGELNERALEQALSESVRRHEVLRTTFSTAGDEVVQVIHPPAPLPVLRLELSAYGAAERRAQLEWLSQAEAAQPFDLAQGPLLRVTLVRLGAAEQVLLLTMHHSISDGWSLGVLVREVAALYAAYSEGQESPLPELELQYADYAAWQREWLQGAQLAEQVGYWKEQLAGVAVLELPTDQPRPKVQRFQGSSLTVTLAAELTASLKELGRGSGATLFMT